MEYLNSAIDYFMEASFIAEVAMIVVALVIVSFIKMLFWKLIGALLFGLVISLFCRFFFDLDDTTTDFVGWCVFFISFGALMKTAGDTADALLDDS